MFRLAGEHYQSPEKPGLAQSVGFACEYFCGAALRVINTMDCKLAAPSAWLQLYMKASTEVMACSSLGIFKPHSQHCKRLNIVRGLSTIIHRCMQVTHINTDKNTQHQSA